MTRKILSEENFVAKCNPSENKRRRVVDNFILFVGSLKLQLCIIERRLLSQKLIIDVKYYFGRFCFRLLVIQKKVG